jgi:hypothetical protein
MLATSQLFGKEAAILMKKAGPHSPGEKVGGTHDVLLVTLDKHCNGRIQDGRDAGYVLVLARHGPAGGAARDAPGRCGCAQQDAGAVNVLCAAAGPVSGTGHFASHLAGCEPVALLYYICDAFTHVGELAARSYHPARLDGIRRSEDGNNMALLQSSLLLLRFLSKPLYHFIQYSRPPLHRLDANFFVVTMNTAPAILATIEFRGKAIDFRAKLAHSFGIGSAG